VKKHVENHAKSIMLKNMIEARKKPMVFIYLFHERFYFGFDFGNSSNIGIQMRFSMMCVTSLDNHRFCSPRPL